MNVTSHMTSTDATKATSMKATTPRRFLPSLRSRLVLLIVGVAVLGFAVGSFAGWAPEPISWQWADSARASTFGDCPAGQICVEWCRLSQGHIEEGTGRLCCGTPDMLGSTNPACPN